MAASISGTSAHVTVRLARIASFTPNSVGCSTSRPAATSAVNPPKTTRPWRDRGAVRGSDIIKNTNTSTSGEATTLTQ
jgi:hypothetical protein